MDRKALRGNQAIGIAAGLLGGAMTAALWPWVPATIGWGGALLWGAAIGTILGSLPQFAAIGRRITRSDNSAFNTAVGLCLPLGLIALLAWIWRLLAR